MHLSEQGFQKITTGGIDGMTKQCIQMLIASIVAIAPMFGNHRSMASQPGVSRPHMVIFLSDDHTWRDSSVYGSPGIDTPNMQRIADAGMTLNRAYVASPSCAPSRAALLTGLYPAKNGAEANHSRPRADVKKLPAYLQAIGYEVVAFGKVAHYRHTPEYGFDVARHFTYHDDIAVEQAINWLRQRKSEKPLCLFVGTNWPHVPWPEETGAIDPSSLVVPPNHVDTPTSRQWRARYMAAIEIMDRELGQVYDAAREVLGDDLFFLHTSDHGAQWPFSKWNLYDDGIRTPMIISWPGRIAGGTRNDAMVSWIDVLPTLLDVAGTTPPENIDGQSMLPVLMGKTAKHRDVIFTTHSGDGNFNVFPIRAVSTAAGWKYIHNLHPEFRFNSHVTNTVTDNGYWPSWVEAATKDDHAKRIVQRYHYRAAEELYNTSTDPYEQNNLIAEPEHQQQLTELRDHLNQWMTQTQDPQTVFGQPQKAPRPGQPNVITVFIDDMGWGDLSCYGGKRVATRNIDRLASEGLRFTQFYVNSPICSPSRVALSTGQYPQRHQITSYLANRQQNNDRGMAQWLDPNAPMLARQLQLSGYATGHFGKWHMGGQRDVGDAPLIQEYGFDRSLTNFEGLGPRVLPLKDAYDGQPPVKHDLGSAALGKGPIRWEDRSQITTVFVDEALSFVDRAKATNQPFFINLWPDDVHSPFFPPRVLRDQTDGSKRQLYYSVMDAMDQQLGKLFDRVRDDPNLRDNTLIVVMSDNGHEEGAGDGGPLRGAKTWLYEGGIRSPLIVWGPGLLAPSVAGTTNDQAVICALDINRSLYSLAKVATSDAHVLDGEDLLPTLLGTATTGRQAPIYWRRPPDRPGTLDQDNPDLAVRDGKWKYLVNYDDSLPQLYDLVVDPSESKNLVADFPEVVARLHQAVIDWNSQMPRDAADPKWSVAKQAGSLPDNQFINPIGEGADPWIIRDPKTPRYLWCMSEGNEAISIHTSDSLTAMGPKRFVWWAPQTGPYSKEVWAPELHFLDDRWYIYFAASDGNNENHLAYVLESRTDDPLGEYDLHGPFATGDGNDGLSPNLWAIDMTVLEHRGKRYALWSGWDRPGSDQQFLYIAPMESPIKLAGPRVKICNNDDFLWERIEPDLAKPGLNEGPQVFQAGGQTSIVYSCGASWLPTYKLGLLELIGDDPLQPDSWRKRPRPVFTSSDATYGLGHSCFVQSPDRSQWWHVFHAKRDRQPGWRRAIFAQPMRVGPRGFPQFGSPVQPGSVVDKPSGEPPAPTLFSFDAINHYGHHQYIDAFERLRIHYTIRVDQGEEIEQLIWDDAKLIQLGRVPKRPINEYRSGEKVIFTASVPSDLRAEVTIDFQGNAQARDAGILFRTTGASIGYDAQRGYFAGLIPATQLVILGKTDGTTWRELARADTTIDPSKPQPLAIEIKKDRITVWHAGARKIEQADATYHHGAVGLRVVDTDAIFGNFKLEPL